MLGRAHRCLSERSSTPVDIVAIIRWIPATIQVKVFPGMVSWEAWGCPTSPFFKKPDRSVKREETGRSVYLNFNTCLSPVFERRSAYVPVKAWISYCRPYCHTRGRSLVNATSFYPFHPCKWAYKGYGHDSHHPCGIYHDGKSHL